MTVSHLARNVAETFRLSLSLRMTEREDKLYKWLQKYKHTVVSRCEFSATLSETRKGLYLLLFQLLVFFLVLLRGLSLILQLLVQLRVFQAFLSVLNRQHLELLVQQLDILPAEAKQKHRWCCTVEFCER